MTVVSPLVLYLEMALAFLLPVDLHLSVIGSKVKPSFSFELIFLLVGPCRIKNLGFGAISKKDQNKINCSVPKRGNIMTALRSECFNFN